ncbi:MAG: U32 family peptidase [Tannerellaceae bacterium]|jgi:collagenase-like PrtC family protease|nr:U32 family peptidase [Tannerellaceae bacterium]
MKQYNIVAPICSVSEVEPVLKAGAGEVYFGIMPENWIKKYGNADFISRRQNEKAHISTYNDLSGIARIANDYGCESTLALNVCYSENQMPYIYEILNEWEARGGHSVITADMEVLLWLDGKGSRLKRQLSVMTGIFNKHSVGFFRQFDISRVVLPRELSMGEIREFMAYTNREVDYEIIVMFQKCEFIDSFCRFYHSVAEEHGCQMTFLCGNMKMNHLSNNDLLTPFCAACKLYALRETGITHFKIAGRAYPPELIIKAVGFIKQTLDYYSPSYADIQHNYKSIFGHSCRIKNCYYR